MSLTYRHRPGGSAYCPQCKEAISKLANVCPHCRSDLSANKEWQAQKEQSAGGCAMLLVFSLIASGIVGLSALRWLI